MPKSAVQHAQVGGESEHAQEGGVHWGQRGGVGVGGCQRGCHARLALRLPPSPLVVLVLVWGAGSPSCRRQPMLARPLVPLLQGLAFITRRKGGLLLSGTHERGYIIGGWTGWGAGGRAGRGAGG